jgi:hypothetical protein
LISINRPRLDFSRRADVQLPRDCQETPLMFVLNDLPPAIDPA